MIDVPRMTRDERVAMIVRLLDNTTAPLTARQIAVRVGVSKRHANRLLEDVCKVTGVRTVRRDVGAPYLAGYYWANKPSMTEEEKHMRNARMIAMIFPPEIWEDKR